MYYPFNKTEILEKLEPLPCTVRAAFVAAAATRIFPSNESIYPTEPGSRILKVVLDAAWNAILHERIINEEIADQLSQAMSVIENASTSNPLNVYAEDCAAVIAYTCRVLLANEAEDAIAGIQHVWESMYRHVKAAEKLTLRGAELVIAINQSQIIQSEFNRQFEDLRDLVDSSGRNINLVKVRAERSRTLPPELMLPTS